MEETISVLNTADYFDYAIDQFNQLKTISESEFEQLTSTLTEYFLKSIMTQERFMDWQINFTKRFDGTKEFLTVQFVEPVNHHNIFIEINRDDTPELILETFMKGYKSSVETFATAVYEMKHSNHK